MVRVQLVKEGTIKYGKNEKVMSPSDAILVMRKYLANMAQEAVVVLNIANDGSVINASTVAIGTLTSCVCSPREIIQTALLSNASGIILLHNHPSGSIKPSQTDLKSTERMKQACDIIGLKFFDHIIVGGRDYYSWNEAQSNYDTDEKEVS